MKTLLTFSHREQRWCSLDASKQVTLRHDEPLLVQDVTLSTADYQPGKRCKNRVCRGFIEGSLLDGQSCLNAASEIRLETFPRLWHNGQEWKTIHGPMTQAKLLLLTPDARAFVVEE